MAKGWKATTRIQHGAKDGEVTTFEVGDPVVGLDKEQMAQLWEAGALEEVAGTGAESAEVTPAAASTPVTSTSTGTSAASSTQQPASSESPPSPKTGTEGGSTAGSATP